MAEWTGEERRSPESISARAAVAARQEAKAFQEALQEVSPIRRARRRKLERDLEQAESREREALSTLGAQS
jgi:hypothetical protein